jgi:glycosyltransferase involved in cell wall biosynthesis
VLRIENSGIEMASNQGVAAARGRFIVRVDADDLLELHYLEQIAPFLKNDFNFCYGDYTVIDGDSMPLELVRLPDFDQAEVMTRGDFLATGTLYPAALFRSAGGYNTSTRNSGLENYELIIKMIGMGVTGVHVPEPLFRYRRHDTNMSVERTDSIVNYGRTLFERDSLGTFRTNQNHPYKLVLSGHVT